MNRLSLVVSARAARVTPSVYDNNAARNDLDQTYICRWLHVKGLLSTAAASPYPEDVCPYAVLHCTPAGQKHKPQQVQNRENLRQKELTIRSTNTAVQTNLVDVRTHVDSIACLLLSERDYKSYVPDQSKHACPSSLLHECGAGEEMPVCFLSACDRQ